MSLAESLMANNFGEVRTKRLRAKRNRRYYARKRMRKRLVDRLTDSSFFITDYKGLIRAIVRRRQALGLRQLAMDDMTKLPDGYQGKLECGMKTLGPTSLPAVLGVLGLKLMVVPDDDRPMVVAKRRGKAWKQRIRPP